MSEMSPNWNIEVIPGAKRMRRAVAVARHALQHLPEGGYPSEYPKHPERMGAAGMLDEALDAAPQPFPGEVGGVIAQPRLEFPTD